MHADATRNPESLPPLPRLVFLCGLLLLLAPPAAQAVGDDGMLASIPRIEVGEVITARPGAGEVLDLTTCVGIALEQNDALRAVRLRRKELDGQMYQALSTGLPTISASLTS